MTIKTTDRQMHEQGLESGGVPQSWPVIKQSNSLPPKSGKVDLPENVGAGRGPIIMNSAEALQPRWPKFGDDVSVVAGRQPSINKGSDEVIVQGNPGTASRSSTRAARSKTS
ncbi:MAG: hypothetical protein MMC23_001887 [Stictis urceolatum]|nr:hypothetical protein [Stictis urceolata]